MLALFIWVIMVILNVRDHNSGSIYVYIYVIHILCLLSTQHGFYGIVLVFA